MANLTGFNIGANQRGILNIGSVINTPLDATLRAVTDGLGNASPLQLSTSSSLISTPDVGFFVGSSIVEIRRNTLNYFRSVNAAASAFVDLQFDVRNAYYQFNAGNGLGLGITSGASSRLHVRGDGTNPIARFENPSATDFITINNSAAIRAETTDTNAEILRLQRNNSYFLSYAPVGLFRIQTISGGAPNGVNNTKWIYFSNRIDSSSNASQAGLMIDTTIACATGSHSPRVFEVGYSINNAASQTGTATGIFLNATETALNGMTHNLMDLQVGGVSRVIYNSNSNILSIGGSGASRIAEIYLKRTDGQNILSLGADGVIGTYQGQNMTFQINSVTQMLISSNTAIQFNYLVRFAGATNAFPALKRNGAALEVRLADDSGTTALNANSFNTASCTIGSNFMSIGGDSGFLRPAASTIAITLNGFGNNHFEFRKNNDTTVVGIIKGTGSPEGVITANQGSIFLRTDGGAGTSFYVKESGTGNTGWVAK